MAVEYISREAAIAETRKPRLTDAELRRRIANIPSADVVPVVRCGECASKYDWPWCGMFPDDGYCSAGVRKDGDGE